MVALNDFTPLQGGIPIEMDGQVVGGIGVSGAASAQQDEEIALAGANAAKTLGTRPPSSSAAITYLETGKVASAFAKGAPLYEVGGYKIHASRREAPGMAEVHVVDTDIVYVLDGTATIVTGGTVVDGKTTATDEIRGRSIQGGETRRLVKGDVVVVPNGVPHWFKEVQAPFLYYVVKVAAPPVGAGTASGGAR
jgi:glc operon protein GlcG